MPVKTIKLLRSKNENLYFNFFEGYYCDKDSIQDAVKRRSLFNIIDHASGFKADFGFICFYAPIVRQIPIADPGLVKQKRNYFVDSFAYVTGSGKYFELVGQDSGKLFGSFIRHQYPDLHTTYYMDPLPYALEEEYIDTTRIATTGNYIKKKIVKQKN